ncbi:unnamed protein product [Hydatigera taeniaeformis]|uniref:Bravo_FIGEY domain-containing protein n=1 Tax=Hydatigena taeniaeformis TaxID=6205 RepID=A0A0R3X9M9_HYDTA|nr:unnamed protein product [Hydatigera taeniaeformis]
MVGFIHSCFRAIKKPHQWADEEADDQFQSKNPSPSHSVKFSDEKKYNINGKPDEADYDDDGDDDASPTSVFSMLPEGQGNAGLSPMRPKTRSGGRADPTVDSVTTLSPLRPGASYTISTSQWDTSSHGMTSVHAYFKWRLVFLGK